MRPHVCVFQLDGKVRVRDELIGEYYGPHCKGQAWLFIPVSSLNSIIRARTRKELGHKIDERFVCAVDTPKPDALNDGDDLRLRSDLIETTRMAQDRRKGSQESKKGSF